jgi:hypothetical protein
MCSRYLPPPLSIINPSLQMQWTNLEQSLRAAETLVADRDDLAVGQLVALLQRGGGIGGGHLLLEVQRHVAQLLLDVAHNLALGGRGEGVATLAALAKKSFRSQILEPTLFF